jgi:outer membrane protein assembly factor BamD (BamD/ComL family)
MKARRNDRYSDYDRGSFVLFVVCITLRICLGAPENNGGGDNNKIVDFTAFQKALEASDDSEALSIGNPVFALLDQKYKTDGDFSTLVSKLTTAEFLAKRMVSQLEGSASRHRLSVEGELSDEKQGANEEWLPSIPSAKKSSKELFQEPIRVANIGDKERTFLAQYYDLKLRIFTSELARAGQALMITEPKFKGTHDYVLVLPLLHASDQKPIDVRVFPRWMQSAGQLRLLSDSCLRHFGFPGHAMTLAKLAAQEQHEQFSDLEFYKSAASKCGESRAHIAADCFRKAMACVPGSDPNTTVALMFELVQVWMNSGSYTLAAGQAHKIFETYPDHKESCRAILLYHHALVRSNDAEQILAHIDEALGDGRCEAYRAKLMFIKWWAFRHGLEESVKVAVLELHLLEEYGDDPVVAPILFARARDHLARQEYDRACELLTQLADKFPSSRSAAEGTKMLDKLKARLTKGEK